jgi:hypothetical protein
MLSTLDTHLIGIRNKHIVIITIISTIIIIITTPAAATTTTITIIITIIITAYIPTDCTLLKSILLKFIPW